MNTEFLKKHRNLFEERLKGYSASLVINSNTSSAENDPGIYRSVLREGVRLTEDSAIKNISVQINLHKRFPFLCAVIKEFPSCCGKAMIYSIGSAGYFCDEHGRASKVIEDEEESAELNSMFFDLCKDIAHWAGYSSCSLIISKQDNPHIFKGLPRIKNIRLANTFENKRNGHTCYDYVMDVR